MVVMVYNFVYFYNFVYVLKVGGLYFFIIVLMEVLERSGEYYGYSYKFMYEFVLYWIMFL